MGINAYMQKHLNPERNIAEALRFGAADRRVPRQSCSPNHACPLWGNGLQNWFRFAIPAEALRGLEAVTDKSEGNKKTRNLEKNERMKKRIILEGLKLRSASTRFEAQGLGGWREAPPQAVDVVILNWFRFAIPAEATRGKQKWKTNIKNKCFEFRSRVTPKRVQSDPKVLPMASPKWPQNDPKVTLKWPQNDRKPI